MSVLITQFEDRVTEIELYFDFLRLVVVEKASLAHGSKRSKMKEFDTELIKILKANAFLLLYNLVESSIRDGLRRIYEAIAKEGLTYERLRRELREVWVHNMVSPDPSRAVEKSTMRVVELIEKIVANELVTFDVKFISVSGSLDAAKVRDLADRYGFSHKTSAKAQGGAVLVDVKRERNNLAHGHKSFAECGRDLTYKNLLMTKNRAIVYMRQILNNVDHYIDNKHYKSAP
jgi:MAE_28990/MAE_18760-like HEPN